MHPVTRTVFAACVLLAAALLACKGGSKQSKFSEMWSVPNGSQLLQECKARCLGKVKPDPAAARVNCT